MVVAFALASCISTSVPDGARASVRYLAVVGDYNQAKAVAVAYAGQPETPLEHVEAILAIVEDGDTYILAFDALRRSDCSDPNLAEALGSVPETCSVTNSDYATAAGALRATSSILRQLSKDAPR